MHAAYFVKTEVFDVSRLDKFINVTVIQMHKILNPHKNSNILGLLTYGEQRAAVAPPPGTAGKGCKAASPNFMTNEHKTE